MGLCSQYTSVSAVLLHGCHFHLLTPVTGNMIQSVKLKPSTRRKQEPFHLIGVPSARSISDMAAMVWKENLA